MAGAKRFEDLIAWQLADQVRKKVYELTDTVEVRQDSQFRDQIRDSASSAARNIAEGFARFEPPQFAVFVNVARASLQETLNHLKHGRSESYFSEDNFTTTWRLACRAVRATNRLHAYLRKCKPRKRPEQGEPAVPDA